MPEIADPVLYATVRSLVDLGTPEAQAACLAKFQATRDPVKRCMLARGMTKVPVVRQILLDEWKQGGAIGRSAALALVTAEDPRAVPALIDVLSMDDKDLAASGLNLGAKWAAERSLAAIADPEAEKALVARTKRRGTYDQKSALNYLADRSSAGARRALKDALQDPDDSTRTCVTGLMFERRDPTDLDDLLVAARKEPAGRVARFMWNAIGAIGGERAVKELLAEAAKGNAAAARGLVSSRHPDCVGAVRGVLTGADAQLRAQLLDGFDTTDEILQSPSAFYIVDTVLPELPKASDDLKAKLTTQLGWTRDPRVIDTLGKLLVNADEPAAVRRAAIKGLGWIGTRMTSYPGIVEPLRHAYEQDTDEETKGLAKGVLMDWGTIPDDRLRKRPRPPEKRVPQGPADPTMPPDEREFPPPPAPDA